jgi:hypothetical protein
MTVAANTPCPDIEAAVATAEDIGTRTTVALGFGGASPGLKALLISSAFRVLKRLRKKGLGLVGVAEMHTAGVKALLMIRALAARRESASKSFVFSTTFRDAFIRLGVPKAMETRLKACLNTKP